MSCGIEGCHTTQEIIDSKLVLLFFRITADLPNILATDGDVSEYCSLKLSISINVL